MLEYIETFILLVFGHFLGDYVFQNDAIAERKSRKNDLKSIEINKQMRKSQNSIAKTFNIEIPKQPKFKQCWFYYLIAHAITHGWLVYYFIGNLWLGVLETVLHAIIDHIKCEGKTTLHTDQLLHLITKIFYIIIMIIGVI